MRDISVLGIDLAKRSFQLHGLDTKGKTVLKCSMTPAKADQFIATLKPCLIGMEACGGAHYQARKYLALGHEVKIIPPQFVKPYVLGNRDDAADASGIAEAASRPRIRVVPIKSEESQTLQNFHRIRDRLMGNRVALSNQTRGILYEYDIKIAKGDRHLRLALIDLANNTQINPLLREQMADLYEELIDLEERIEVINKKLEELVKQSDDCQRLMKIPGVGPIVATAIYASVSHAEEFCNGRQFSAWLGITPGHRQTGGPKGKKIMLGITKRGDHYLRKMLIQGARCYLIQAGKRSDKISQWAEKLRKEKGFNKAAVALANKIARIIWVVLAKKEIFRMPRTQCEGGL